MTTIVNISNRAMTLIRASLLQGHTFNQTGVQQPDGTWDVPLSEEVIDELTEQQLEGEHIKDTIERILSFYVHGGLQ